MSTIRNFAIITLFILFATVGCRKGQPTEGTSSEPPAQISSSLEDVRSPKKGLRVLFVGNSFTFFHNMPGTVARLAQAANEELPLMAIQEAPGGRTLQQHWEDGAVTKLIDSAKWDWVVLQEQSQLPASSPAVVASAFHPFVLQLHEKIKENGAKTMLFLTWGYKNGDPFGAANDSFAKMQSRLTRSYRESAKSISAEIAPVGLAWEEAIKRNPNFELWDGDGRHPNVKGVYLTACVFYGQLYGKSPVGNSHIATLDAADAAFLQEVAAFTLERWRKDQAQK